MRKRKRNLKGRRGGKEEKGEERGEGKLGKENEEADSGEKQVFLEEGEYGRSRGTEKTEEEAKDVIGFYL